MAKDAPDTPYALAWRMAEIIADNEGFSLDLNASRDKEPDRAYVLKLLAETLAVATQQMDMTEEAR